MATFKEYEIPRELSNYSVEHARSILGCSKVTIWELIHSGELPSTRVGKRYRILHTDLEAYYEQGKGGDADADKE